MAALSTSSLVAIGWLHHNENENRIARNRTTLSNNRRRRRSRFFSKPRNIRLTEADWFPGRVRRGEALLFIVEDDEYRGEYIALTPRGPAHLGEVLAAYKLASVVVHRIKNPTATFNGDKEDAFPIGMGAAKRL